MLISRRVFLAFPTVAAAEDYNAIQSKAQMKATADFACAFDVYLRQLFGCPNRNDWRAEMCEASKGTVDASAYLKCRKLAKVVFDL